MKNEFKISHEATYLLQQAMWELKNAKKVKSGKTFQNRINAAFNKMIEASDLVIKENK